MYVRTFLAAPSMVTTGVSIKVFAFWREGVGAEVIGTLQLGDLAGLEANAGGLEAGWAGRIGTGFEPSLPAFQVCETFYRNSSFVSPSGPLWCHERGRGSVSSLVLL